MELVAGLTRDSEIAIDDSLAQGYTRTSHPASAIYPASAIARGYVIFFPLM